MALIKHDPWNEHSEAGKDDCILCQWERIQALEVENASLRSTRDEFARLVSEAHAAFCDMKAGTDVPDTRWMLEAQILLEGKGLPKRGLTVGELKRILRAEAALRGEEK